VAYRILEDWSRVDSFYFCTVAVTTVGFGDLPPSTAATKLFTVLYIFSGLTIISVWLNARFKHHAAKAVVTRTGPATDASDSIPWLSTRLSRSRSRCTNYPPTRKTPCRARGLVARPEELESPTS
jgi:hypothetical protein